MKTSEALDAIQARSNGEWDNSNLLQTGELLPDTQADILRIKERCLLDYGYEIGVRDPRLNSDYPGCFMVVESHEPSELPTRDGRNGPWCIVGDDLAALVTEAFEVLCTFDLDDGTNGQDRKSYSDNQDRDSYTVNTEKS